MDNKQIARDFFENAWSNGNLDAVDRVIAPGSRNHDPYSSAYGAGADGLKNMIRVYRKAFPDLKMVVDQQFTDGNYVITCWTATGTHQGELMGLQPTRRRATTPGISVDRFENGRVVESWTQWDLFGLMQQLGAPIAKGMPVPNGHQPQAK